MSTCFFYFFIFYYRGCLSLSLSLSLSLHIYIYIYTVYKGDKKKIMIKWRFELNAWSIAYIG